MRAARPWLVAALVDCSLAALIAYAVACAAIPTPALAAPKVEVAERTVDFGTIAPNEVSARQVAVRNAGDEPLVFGEARVVSEQARAAAARDTLPAGGESVLRVALLPAARGPLETKVVFTTNDPAEPTIVLVLRAQVEPRCVLDIEPRFLGVLRPGEASKAEIAIRFRAGLGARLDGAESSLPFVRLATRPGADSLEAVVTMGLAPDAPRGLHHGDAALAVSYPQRDTLHVLIGVEVTGRWRVVPFPFAFGKTRLSAPEIPSILCERTVKKTARVFAASTDIPEFRTAVETVEEGRVYRVRLLPTAAWTLGTWKGAVRIQTDDPQEPEIIVPTSVFVGKT